MCDYGGNVGNLNVKGTNECRAATLMTHKIVLKCSSEPLNFLLGASPRKEMGDCFSLL